jgi:hypothetical protein
MRRLENRVANYEAAVKYLKSVNSPRKPYYNMPLPTENQYKLYRIFWNIIRNNNKHLNIIRKSNVNNALANYKAAINRNIANRKKSLANPMRAKRRNLPRFL